MDRPSAQCIDAVSACAECNDETSAEIQAMRTALARLCAIDSAVNTQRDPDQKLN